VLKNEVGYSFATGLDPQPEMIPLLPLSDHVPTIPLIQ
jgi:hypothetical protein